MGIMNRDETPFAEVTDTDVEIAGEIISWDLTDPKDRGRGGLRVSHTQVKMALETAGLDTAEARDKEPRDAFARAARSMVNKQIIRKVPNGTDNDHIKFQLTDEFPVGDGLGYDRNAVIIMDLKTGSIQCDDKPELAKMAEQALKEAMEERTGSDVVAIAHRILMKGDVDLFPIRWKGGAYFVAARSLHIVDQIEKYFDCLRVTMNRWPIARGTSRGDRSIAETVADGLESYVDDLMVTIGKLSIDSRPSSFERTAEAINDQRFKVQSYSDMLGVLKDRVDEALDNADAELHRIVSVISEGGDPHAEEGEETTEDEAQDGEGATAEDETEAETAEE